MLLKKSRKLAEIAKLMSTLMCEASRYATTPSTIAGHVSAQSQTVGSSAINPPATRGSDLVLPSHSSAFAVAKQLGISLCGLGVSEI